MSLELAKLEKQLADLAIKLAVKREVVKHLAETGHSADQGARGVRKTIQENVEDLIASLILSDRVKSGQTIQLILNDNGKQKTIDVKTSDKVPA